MSYYNIIDLRRKAATPGICIEDGKPFGRFSRTDRVYCKDFHRMRIWRSIGDVDELIEIRKAAVEADRRAKDLMRDRP